MQEEVYIKLKFIEDDLVPEEITRLIGIAPAIAGRRGDLIRGRKLPIKEGLWCCKRNIAPPWDIGDALDGLLPLIENNEELKQYCRDFNIYVEFSIIMYLADNAPIVTLAPSLLRRIANAGAAINFDIYLLSAPGIRS